MSRWSSVKRKLSALAALTIFWSGMQAQDGQCREIFNQMFDAINNVRTLRYNLSSMERIGNVMTQAHSMVKLNISPFEIYYKNFNNGIEVLWREGKVDGDAIVNPNGFPYVNLHLNPSGELMRKGQHQTLLRLGYSYLGDMLFHSFEKFPDAVKNYAHRLNDTVWDNAPCYKIDINFKDFANTSYIVTQAGETVAKIAARYFLNEYEVLTLNNISWYNDELKVGQTLNLPAAYAKHVALLISKTTNLPMVIKVYDDKGLYEMYAYTNLQLNLPIPNEEFTESYSGYHF